VVEFTSRVEALSGGRKGRHVAKRRSNVMGEKPFAAKAVSLLEKSISYFGNYQMKLEHNMI
jgi:hypothetical protein